MQWTWKLCLVRIFLSHLQQKALTNASSAAVNATATCVRMLKNSSLDNFVSATTSLVIVTTRFSALVLTTVFASAVHASVTTVGEATLANAAVRLTHAKPQMEKSARDMELVVAVAASVKLKKTSDIQENTVRSAQHVQVVVTS